MDKISVVVPVYNVKKYLEKSFESIADFHSVIFFS